MSSKIFNVSAYSQFGEQGLLVCRTDGTSRFYAPSTMHGRPYLTQATAKRWSRILGAGVVLHTNFTLAIYKHFKQR